MKRSILWTVVALAAVAICGALAGYFLSNERARQTEPSPPVVESPPATTNSPGEPPVEAKPPAGPQPAAFTPETKFDFGVVEPNGTCSHEFVIENRGEGPLALDKGRTSCQCTVSELTKTNVAPGESASVTISTDLKSAEGPFAHRAAITTNDPKRPQIELQIEGKVAWVLTADRKEIRISLPPQAEYSSPERIFIYSETWKQFEVRDVRPSLQGVRWTVESADAAMLRSYNATAGYVMIVEIPSAKEGQEQDVSLDVTAVSDKDPNNEKTLRLTFRQTIRKRVELSGPAFHAKSNTLTLGRIIGYEPAGQEMLLIIRASQPPAITKTETMPDFLKVDVEPVSDDKGATHLFRIHVEVPTDAPGCNYLSPPRLAHVKIHTDDPEIEPIEFDVAFAVVSR